MDNVMIYRIVMHNNRGCAPIAAIADSVDGVWFNSVDRYDGQRDLVFLELPAENAGYLDGLLDADDNVVSYEDVTELHGPDEDSAYRVTALGGRFDHVRGHRAAIARARQLVGAPDDATESELAQDWGARIEAISRAQARSVGLD